MPILTVLFWFAVLVVSLFVLLKSADYFVDTAELFGKKLKVPSFIIGATVVAFGTSLPELAVGLASIFKEQPGILTGTVIGSNVSNIFLIGGIAILLSSGFLVRFKKHAIEFSLLAGTAFMLSYFLWDYRLGLVEALICVALLFGYVAYIVMFPHEDDEEDEDEDEESLKFGPKLIGLFVLSGVGIWAGAEFTTMAIKKISILAGLGSDVISLTVVALGTSLPELAVTIAAVKKLKFNLVMGNIIGSNIFNTLCVVGIPGVVGYFAVSPEVYTIYNPTFHNFSIPMMLIATVALLFLGILKTTPRFFGVLFVLLYLFFIVGSFAEINLWGLVS